MISNNIEYKEVGKKIKGLITMFEDMNNGMTPNQVKALAYMMTIVYGSTQQKAADFFNVTQSTISSWVKEAEYLIQINKLTKELQFAEQQIQQLLPPR